MIAAALDELDLSAVLSARLEQQDKYGHTPASDAELPVAFIVGKLTDMAQAARDPAMPGGQQDLDLSYRRCAKLGAMVLAAMVRIRLEQERARG